MKMHNIISVAPMMDWTDRHCRYFHRLIAPRARLYTEMITAQAVLRGDRERLLGFSAEEKPLALQLGGSDPDLLGQAAAIAQDYSYDEVNLNCGCPSERVQSGRFGACLMEEPELVARCVQAMTQSCTLPVTVKCRTGIDHQDDAPFLDRFIRHVRDAGCKTVFIHARKAWLSGLSPKENREVPPLDYGRVLDIKARYPDMSVHINGGIRSLDLAIELLEQMDGIMIGREAYQNPWFLHELESALFNAPLITRKDIAMAMIPYTETMARQNGTPVKSITRHMLGLYHSRPGARSWRRILCEESRGDDADAQVIMRALREVER
jgi:tRNA-dihydrouridine synthase A